MSTLFHTISQNLTSWGLVLAGLVAAVYTLRVIRSEMSVYKRSGQPVHLGDHHFIIPSWWSLHQDSTQDHLMYYRKDTHYDWLVSFQLMETSQTPEHLMQTILDSRKIVFDRPTLSCSSEDGPTIRQEGTATVGDEDRIYYDICIIQHDKNTPLLVCENRSSVLNGLIEGPYFEEILGSLGGKKTNPLNQKRNEIIVG